MVQEVCIWDQGYEKRGQGLFSRKWKPTSPIKDEEAKAAHSRSSHPCLKMKEASTIELDAIPTSKEEGDKVLCKQKCIPRLFISTSHRGKLVIDGRNIKWASLENSQEFLKALHFQPLCNPPITVLGLSQRNENLQVLTKTYTEMFTALKSVIGRNWRQPQQRHFKGRMVKLTVVCPCHRIVLSK